MDAVIGAETQLNAIVKQVCEFAFAKLAKLYSSMLYDILYFLIV